VNDITIIFTIAFVVLLPTILILGFVCTRESLWEHEAGLLFRHGKFVRELKTGEQRLWGRGYRVLRFDTRWRELQVVGQEMLTADRATVRLTAVAVYRIADARLFHQVAEDATRVLYTAVQLALRDLAGSQELEALIERKANLGEALSERLGESAKELGLELREIAVRDLTLSGDLKRSYAAVIQARAESLAAIEKARGESAAIRTLANAARSFDKNPHLLQLRYLQMLEEKDAVAGSTFVVGDPAGWVRQNT
jgi:regulator of protease activity HflC (stomatin/prohibitin superfamily)